MKKKLLSIVLISACVLCFCACGKKDDNKKEESNVNDNTLTSTETTSDASVESPSLSEEGLLTRESENLLSGKHNIEIEIELPKDFLKSDEYLTCEGNEFKSDLSKRFYRNYLISKANGDHESEFQSLLYCAWTCDDAEDDFAVKVRKLALKSMDNTDAESADEKRNLLLMRIDLLRRSLQFERVIEEFKDFKDDDEVFYSIIRFQLKLAVNEDSGCYTVEDVVKEFNLDSE